MTTHEEGREYDVILAGGECQSVVNLSYYASKLTLKIQVGLLRVLSLDVLLKPTPIFRS